MKTYTLLQSLILFLCLGTLLSACTDDKLYSDAGLTDGETTLNLDIEFSPFASGDLTRANIEDGNGKALAGLKDLCLLVYDTEGNIIDDAEYPHEVEFDNNDLKDENRNDTDASNGQTAESSTKSLKNIPLKLPFGTYYIVGVANLKGGTATKLKSGDDYKTLEGLMRMKMEWSVTNLSSNGEMMGYFTLSDSNVAPSDDHSFETVSVNRPGLQLHAWLRRCASKITIDFDGSNLRENVTVYFKEARICHIPTTCSLGFGKKIDLDNEGMGDFNNRPSSDDDILKTDNGQRISYSEGDEHMKWNHISKGSPKLTSTGMDTYAGQPINFHAETADALYFYENMQDNTTGCTKVPVPDLGNGSVVQGPDKDGIEFGTYIEVEGYYFSKETEGKIVYRFMLGKNVTDNFEAERNYHYKLTLKPRGNGNDADWHIDFEKPKGFHVPNPCYISYLYNHDTSLPFTYTPEEGWEVVGLKASIEQNPWYPSDIPTADLAKPEITVTPTAPDGEDNLAYTTTQNQKQCNGFLSMRATTKVVITNKEASDMTDFKYENNDTYTEFNKKYYEGKSAAALNVDRSQRVFIEYDKDKQTITIPPSPNHYTELEKNREKFEWGKDGDSYNFKIPMFTRAKVMVKQSGYTGNNPFVGYQRVAKVKLTVTLRNTRNLSETKDETAMVNVVQVRRVVNPKGVYRSSTNFQPFHVKMMWLKGDDAESFNPVESDGPWMAEIIGDQNFITLDGKQTVSGATGSEIDFNIKFNRIYTGSAPRNAVVRIKYHNYTCTHLIFVRQGYDPQTLVPASDAIDFNNRTGGATPTVWSTFNMIAKNVLTQDPRDEGSMFKFGNSEAAIDAVNNVYKDAKGNPVYKNLSFQEFNDFRNSTLGPFVLADDDTYGKVKDDKVEWGAINSDSKGFTSGEMAKTATVRDFEQLYLSKHMQFGYGVLYADGATQTQELVKNAYGYYRGDKDAAIKGMRGLFAYRWDGNVDNRDGYNGRNVFFPIGRSGYGHRKNNHEWDDKSTDADHNGKGVLRYAIRYKPSSQYKNSPAPPNFIYVSPLFESIYRRPGAIYWARHTVDNEKYLAWDASESKDGTSYGLDINYFSFDVNAITGTNVNDGGSACFVRCVK